MKLVCKLKAGDPTGDEMVIHTPEAIVMAKRTAHGWSADATAGSVIAALKRKGFKQAPEAPKAAKVTAKKAPAKKSKKSK